MIAATILLLTVPLLIVIALGVTLTSAGPALFRHERVGRGGRRFSMLKFRTMHVGRTGPQVTAKADRRITALGKVLRKTKLDELPELWNVVRGDMALVGPRPESTAYVDLSDEGWQAVLTVPPGVTDPMTLILRNEEELLAASGAEYEAFYRGVLVPYKLRGYRAYLSSRTWRTDLAVLGRTVLAIFFPASAPPPELDDLLAWQPQRDVATGAGSARRVS